MKKLVILLAFYGQMVNAQEIKIIKTTQLTTINSGAFAFAQFIPQSEQILVSKPDYNGLFLVHQHTKDISTITNQSGSGYQPAISPDGKKIVYRINTIENNLKYTQLIEKDVATSESNILLNKGRNVSPAQFTDNQLIYSEQSNVHTKQYIQNQYKSVNSQYLRLENMKPVIYNNKSSRIVAPNGDGNYFWASLSPDKSKLVYAYAGKGTFICDTNGIILATLGSINAPKWLTNTLVIGMNDKDNGITVTSSDIVYYSLTTNKITNLTNTPNQFEMYPAVSETADKIVYNTSNGEIFLITIQIK